MIYYDTVVSTLFSIVPTEPLKGLWFGARPPIHEIGTSDLSADVVEKRQLPYLPNASDDRRQNYSTGLGLGLRLPVHLRFRV